VLGEDLALSFSRRQRAEMKVSVTYTNPISAPIQKGQQIGTLTVELPNRTPITSPLLAREDVGEISGFGKITAALEHLLFGTAGREAAPQE
jgi:D-alanyl-D-alanine carboxypeptidase (penicillin-binding protein 5/6)